MNFDSTITTETTMDTPQLSDSKDKSDETSTEEKKQKQINSTK